jgi:hypothetical protein
MYRRNCDGPIEEVLKQIPRERGGEGKESPQLTIGMTLVPILLHSHTEREENTQQGELMSTADAIYVKDNG